MNIGLFFSRLGRYATIPFIAVFMLITTTILLIRRNAMETLFIVCSLIAIVSIPYSAGLCLTSSTILLITFTSFKRLERANRKINEHNVEFLANEPEFTFSDAFSHTCSLHYYWLIPALTICLLITANDIEKLFGGN